MNMSQFKDENGQSMIPNIIKKREVPIQIENLSVGESLESAGSVTKTTSTSVGISNGIL